MTTIIKLGITKESIEQAASKLEDWEIGKFKPVVASYMVRGVIPKVREGMSGAAHTGQNWEGDAGRLKRTILSAVPERLGYGRYELTIDAVHKTVPDTHYAEEELNRGGDHDFTRDNRLFAENEADDLWRSGEYKAKL